MLDKRQILGLLSTTGVGVKSVHRLIARIDSQPQTVKDLHEALLCANADQPRFRAPRLADVEMGFKEAERTLDKALREGIIAIPLCSPEFPKRLKAIPDPPVILFAKGNVSALHNLLTVAVVGTRAPTEHGRKVAERLGERFAGNGFVVASGLALGCDTAAHVGCLREHGVTVAVLAHGLDTVYPAKNRKLADDILHGNGCLLSEYPPGTKSRRNYFVERDRLQSGLSLGVIVIETDTKGGTMHTVGFSIDQGRLLACLVHPAHLANEPTTQGNKQLLADGKAIPLADSDDLVGFINRMRSMAERVTDVPGDDRAPQVSQRRDTGRSLFETDGEARDGSDS